MADHCQNLVCLTIEDQSSSCDGGDEVALGLVELDQNGGQIEHMILALFLIGRWPECETEESGKDNDGNAELHQQ